MAIPFPDIDPVAFSIGVFSVRWYSLAYIVGFLGGIQYAKHLASLYHQRPITKEKIDDFMLWAVLGTILGGRLGYVLFYNLPYYLQHPLDALQIWQGGMSFHGGLLGVTCAIILFARKHRFNPLYLGDVIACAAPIGLFFGRIANFINGELFGRVTDMPWGIIFPNGGGLPRHPSQLYEAGLEGLVLFIILSVAFRLDKLREKSGIILGLFLVLYALARFSVEFVREPDAHLGFIIGSLTMGQLLTLPMAIIGAGFITYAIRTARNTA